MLHHSPHGTLLSLWERVGRKPRSLRFVVAVSLSCSQMDRLPTVLEDVLGADMTHIAGRPLNMILITWFGFVNRRD